MSHFYLPLSRFVSLVAAFSWFVVGPASAQTAFGSLSNFDVFNDTGHETYGFEIELDGVSSQDIDVTFGSPYIRYGDPKIIDIPGGVLIRYQSPYDSVRGAFTVATPVPPSITPTAGHQCWTLASPAYPTSGCEHFGVGLFKNPTSAQYHWLVADPSTPGGLQQAPTGVNIAVPIWTVAPAAAGAAPIVKAVIAPPKAPAGRHGDAVWVKVYETESPDKVELRHLLTDDPVVPQAAGQAEVEWEISQSNPKKADNGALEHGKPLGNGNHSVIRRFEFYKFTGLYRPDDHEAVCADGKCKAPGPGELGDYIGAQMAAVQIGPAAAAPATITGVSNNASGEAAIESGSWVSIYGTNLSATTRTWRDSDFVGNNLPTALDGVSVTINGKAAAVAYISPGQLNVQAPTDNATGPVQVQVTNSAGSASGTAALAQYAPAFFTFQGKYAAAVHTDSALAAPAGFFGNAVNSRAAKPGEILMIFGTGFGPTNPGVAAGQMVNGAARLADPSQLHIRIGGVEAEVQFAGIAAPGEYQFNVVIPALPDGDQPIVADIGGVSTPAGLSIAVKN